MKKKTKRIVAICVIILFLLAAIIPVGYSIISPLVSHGAPLPKDLQQKADGLKKTQQQLTQARELMQNTLNQKKIIDDSISSIAKDINGLNGDIKNLDSQMVVKQLKIDEISKDLATQYETLKKRLRVMQEDGVSSYLEVIFNSNSLSEFMNRYDTIGLIVEYDKQLMNKIQLEKTQIEKEKADLQGQKSVKEAKVADRVAKKSDLDKKEKEAKKLLESTSSEVQRLEEEERQAQEAQKQLAALQRQQGNIKYTGGRLMWPVPGYTEITSPFGMRYHPILKVNAMHSGIDIAVPSGTTVVAAANGVVITASYDSGYGNLVAVDHGGIITRYAHNSALLVSVGDKVNKGQALALSGSTGMSTGPHVHFEVFENGQFRDPLNYVK